MKKATKKRAVGRAPEKKVPKEVPRETPKEVPKAAEPAPPAPRPRLFRIVLIEGATLWRRGRKFVLGREEITDDEELYGELKSNGRFRCDVLKKGGS